MKQMVCLTMFLFLVACGGGGSSSSGGNDSPPDDNTPEETTEVQRISLTGLAVKGLAKNAKVAVFTLSGSAFKTEADVTALTDKTGRYALRLPESLATYNGPAKIVLSYNDESSQLQCDDNNGCGTDVNFGDFYTMPVDFELATVVNIGTGLTNANGDTIANISALTSLAADYLERGNVTATNLKQSNNQIRALFSLPSSVLLVSTEPQIISNDNANGDAIYGAINAAFLKVANDSDTSLSDVIDDFSAEIIAKNGQLFQKPPVDSEAPSILAITSAAEALGVLAGDELEAVVSVKDAANALAAGTVTTISPPSISLAGNQSVNAGDTVSIPVTVESGTTDNATYNWQVLAGPLNLVGNASATTNTLTFTAPAQGGDIKLRVIFSNANGTDNDIVVVKVAPALAGDTAKTGTYLLSGMGRKFFGGGSYLQFESEIWTDELNLTFNSDGSGSIVGAAANESVYFESAANLSTPASLSFGTPQSSVGTIGAEDTFNLGFSQLANDSLQVIIPSEVDENVDAGNGNIEYYAARQFNFFEMGEGLYAGFNFELATEYQVVNGVQSPDANARSVGTEFLSLSKDNATLSSFTQLANKAYTGIEWRTFLASAPSFSSTVTKVSLVFNADGSSFDVNEEKQELTGIPNTNQVGEAISYQLLPTTAGPETNFTNVFTMENGRFGRGLPTPAGNVVSNAIAADLSAFTSVGYSYTNTAGTDFNAGQRTEEEISGAVYLEKPAATIDLNDKQFNVKLVNYLVENPDNTITNGIAPEVAMEQYVGTVTFTDGELKLDLQLQKGILTYPDGVVGTGTVNAEITYALTTERETDAIALTTTTTDVDGCVKADVGNFEFCVSDNGAMIGWNYGETTEGTYSDVSVAMLIGKQGDSFTPSGFTNADLTGNSFTLTFSDGDAPYVFSPDGIGSVTFPGNSLESFNWFIDAQGRIIVALAGGETDRYTLTSGAASSGTVSLEIDSGQGYEVIADEANNAWVML